MVEALLSNLKDRGVKHVFLFSRDAGEFWKKFGFIECGGAGSNKTPFKSPAGTAIPRRPKYMD